MSDSKQMSFVVDGETLALIQSLKKELGATTAAGVLRKAIALASVAVDQAKNSDGIVTLNGRGQDAKDAVSIALRA